MGNTYFMSIHLNKCGLKHCIFAQGRREGGAEGAVCPRASGSRGPHQLISKFLFTAYFDVFKKPENKSSLQGSKSVSRSSSHRNPCFLPLLLASITDTRGLILQFYPWTSKTSRRTCICVPIPND